MPKKVLVLYPKQNYVRALESVGLTPVFNLTDGADGLLLTGGGDLSPCSYKEPDLGCRDVDLKRDQTEFFFTEKFFSANKPILGICRGMQLVNVFFGGTLFQEIKHHDQITGKDRTHGVSIKRNSVLYGLYGEKLKVNSAHRQAVKQKGNNLTISAISGDGVIEALEAPNVILTQFHPERLGTDGLKIFDYFKSLL